MIQICEIMKLRTAELGKLRLTLRYPLWESLKAKGLVRAARFSWKESIEKHVQVYQAVLG